MQLNCLSFRQSRFDQFGREDSLTSRAITGASRSSSNLTLFDEMTIVENYFFHSSFLPILLTLQKYYRKKHDP